MNKPTVILANGHFPESEKSINILDSADFIVCCDGAANKLIESGREPHLIIGDLDSVDVQYKKQYTDRLVHDTDQMTNDLSKAVNWCIEHNRTSIVVLGATGEREDHTIANIGLLSEYHKSVNIKMVTDLGVFIPFSEDTSFASKPGQQISIFSLSPDEPISSEALKYSLDKLVVKAWWMGTLNEAVSNSFTLKVKKGSRWIVYLLDK